MTDDEKITWNILKNPLEKNCWNCEHRFSALKTHDYEICNPCMAEFILNGTRGYKWKWDGETLTQDQSGDVYDRRTKNI